MSLLPEPAPWPDLATRISLAVLAALIIGYNRREHGKTAGLRTTLMVCLAATIAMILANSLLATTGRTQGSFVQIDPMRLPLGILTGVGFIGGGAILRRGDLILGVTTAATLWFSTVIGLCFGAGQLGLGLVTTLIGASALWGLKWIEDLMPRERRTRLLIELASASGPGEAEIRRRLGEARLRVVGAGLVVDAIAGRRTIVFEIAAIARDRDLQVPAAIEALAAEAFVTRLEWGVRGAALDVESPD